MSAAERARREEQARQEEQARREEYARQREQARQEEKARKEAEAREKELARQREIARREEHARTLRREHPEIINNLIANMVFVKGGKFIMGSDKKGCLNDEFPVHEVTLSDFSIGRYEVTQEEWEAVMGDNPSSFKGAKRPVEGVLWEDCQVFIAKLNEITGKTFRLPTEAEWEYAARGGRKGGNTRYAGSNKLAEVAWYYDNNNSSTHDVGMMLPNKLGLYDMSGNVWEWCADWYGRYGSVPQVNPMGPSSGDLHVLRGGSWCSGRYNSYYEDAMNHRIYNVTVGCRVYSRWAYDAKGYRSYSNPEGRSNEIGLRLVLVSS